MYNMILSIIIGLIFLIHGLIHFLGFLVPWQLITAKDLPYKTSLLAGNIEVGNQGIRMVGIVWLLVGLAFIGIAAAAVLQVENWQDYTFGVTLVSIALCILGWPESKIGFFLNMAILMMLLLKGNLSFFH